MIDKSALTLPNNPSEQRMTPYAIKNAMTCPMFDDENSFYAYLKGFGEQINSSLLEIDGLLYTQTGNIYNNPSIVNGSGTFTQANFTYAYIGSGYAYLEDLIAENVTIGKSGCTSKVQYATLENNTIQGSTIIKGILTLTNGSLTINQGNIFQSYAVATNDYDVINKKYVDELVASMIEEIEQGTVIAGMAQCDGEGNDIPTYYAKKTLVESSLNAHNNSTTSHSYLNALINANSVALGNTINRVSNTESNLATANENIGALQTEVANIKSTQNFVTSVANKASLYNVTGLENNDQVLVISDESMTGDEKGNSTVYQYNNGSFTFVGDLDSNHPSYTYLLNNYVSKTTYANDEENREANETTRQANEVVRQTNETARELAEDTRLDNESERETNESTRQSNEASRQTAESSRVSAEIERTTTFNSQMTLTNEKIETMEAYNFKVTLLESSFENLANLVTNLIGEGE